MAILSGAMRQIKFANFIAKHINSYFIGAMLQIKI
jgi:hypothetical protein